MNNYRIVFANFEINNGVFEHMKPPGNHEHYLANAGNV